MKLMKLITIEDQDDWQYLIKKTIDKESIFEYVANFKCGDDFFEKYDSVDPVDFIILDICLPITSGINVAKRIKKEYSQLPIIVFTSSRNRSDRFEFEEIGVAAYISKRRILSLNDDLQIIFGLKEHKSKHRFKPIPYEYINLIEYVCSGLSNEEIAKKLKTKSKHIEYQLKKVCDYFQLDNSKLAIVDFAKTYDLL